MLVIIYISGIEDGLVRESETFEDAVEIIETFSPHCINKVVITDLQPTVEPTKSVA